MENNIRAPKAPPMMGPIGSFDIAFPCTTSVASPAVALNVGLDEEDCGVENDEEDSSFRNDEENPVEYDDEADNTGEFGVVDGAVVTDLRDEVVRDGEGSLGGVPPSLTIKKSKVIESFV